MKFEHQKFAELRATGKSASEAYMLAYSKLTLTAAVNSAAARLDAQSNIIAKVKELRDRADAASEAAAVLTIIEKRKFLAEIVRTPVTELDPAKNPHLIRKRTRKMLGTGENAEEIEEIEGYDKIKAITVDSELTGDTGSDLTRAFAEVLKNIPQTGSIIPTDTM